MILKKISHTQLSDISPDVDQKAIEELLYGLYDGEVQQREIVTELPAENFEQKVNLTFDLFREVVRRALGMTPTTHAIEHEPAEAFDASIQKVRKTILSYEAVVANGTTHPAYVYRAFLQLRREASLTAAVSFIHELKDTDDSSSSAHFIEYERADVATPLAD